MLKKSFGKRILMFMALAGLLGVAGCIPLEKFERTQELSGPIAAGATLTATTHNGSIRVTGGDVSECKVIAKITTRANKRLDTRFFTRKVDPFKNTTLVPVILTL